MGGLEIERDGDRYIARDVGGIVWTVELRHDMAGTPFREEVVWPAASVVAIGGGNVIHFLALASGDVVRSLSLDDDLFGHFGPADGDVLCILGWRHVLAVDRTLAVRWLSKDIAVDGITWRGQDADRIQLSGEMDPPGGWVDIDLDAATGAELSRGAKVALPALFSVEPWEMAALDWFVGSCLTSGGIWNTPRQSDGISTIERVLEHGPDGLSVCARIYEIDDQSLHTFWLALKRGAADRFAWVLYFDVIETSRRANAAHDHDRPEDIAWRVTLFGEATVVDGVLAIVAGSTRVSEA